MSTKRIWIALGACLATFGTGYGVRVLAEGAPVEQPLFYSGVLETNGELASGTHMIKLELFDAESGGNMGCSIERTAEVEAGRFRIDASECADPMRDNPEVWVAVSFTDANGVMRAIPGRSKVGAVPYALEADHAKAASAASGALEETIAQLTARIEALEASGGGGGPATGSAFQALKRQQQDLAQYGTVLVFDEEVFDLANEYNPENGTFTAADDGYYEFFCSIAWSIDGGQTGQYEAAIFLNDSEVAYNGFTTDGGSTTRQVHAVLDLAAGDRVQCSAFAIYEGLELNLSNRNTSFEGRRFSL